MTRRERFITAAKRGMPDRAPVFASLTPQVAEVLGKKYNLPIEPEDSFLSTRISHVEILNLLGNDAIGAVACRQKDRPTIRLEIF
jgi:uroporphyrinogen decarboxylase